MFQHYKIMYAWQINLIDKIHIRIFSKKYHVSKFFLKNKFLFALNNILSKENKLNEWHSKTQSNSFAQIISCIIISRSFSKINFHLKNFHLITYLMITNGIQSGAIFL